MAYRWMVSLTLAALAAGTGFALAQGTFPAPLPGQAATPTDSSTPKAVIGGPTPFSSAGTASSVPSPCMTDFVPLREDAEKKGKLIREATVRRAPPDEACKIIGNYSAAEVKMIKYVETNATKCGIPARVADQLKAGHKNTEGLLQKVCGIAEQIRTHGSPGQINDFGDPAFWKGTPRGPAGDFPDAHSRF
jgi:hypothetical protein